jgi:hypothetical protein
MSRPITGNKAAILPDSNASGVPNDTPVANADNNNSEPSSDSSHSSTFPSPNQSTDAR